MVAAIVRVKKPIEGFRIRTHQIDGDGGGGGGGLLLPRMIGLVLGLLVVDWLLDSKWHCKVVAEPKAVWRSGCFQTRSGAWTAIIIQYSISPTSSVPSSHACLCRSHLQHSRPRRQAYFSVKAAVHF